MKKKSIILLAMATILAFASCQQKSDTTPVMEQQPVMGELTVSVSQPLACDTKAATAYTQNTAQEIALKNLQYFVFDSEGKINAYKNGGVSTNLKIGTTTGTKRVVVVANAPEMMPSIKTLSELQTKTMSLDANSVAADGSFVMCGEAICNVTQTGAEADVRISRFVSRIVLQSVTNSLPAGYGAMRLKAVYLSNVVGEQNYGANLSAQTWHNYAGRRDGASASTDYVTATTAYCPSLTYKDFSTPVSIALNSEHKPGTPYFFYCFPNSSTSSSEGWGTSQTSRRTRMVLVIEVGGKDYFYPATINLLERNKTYSVGVTITGLGSNDPDVLVVKQNISANVTMENWVNGAVYNEEF